jgi:cytochrome c-type biogenesis protein CcmH/NrfG
VWTSLAVFLVAAVLCAIAGFWVLRAYRRAGGGSQSPRPALMISGLVALIALGTYLAIGRPELPDAPYSARLAALTHRDPTTYTFDEAIAVLADAGRRNIHDPLPHLYSGELLLRQGRAREAADSFEAALRREPNLPEAMIGLGRSLVRAENGRITPEALSLFQRAGAMSSDPTPWIYQALAATEANDPTGARRFWGQAAQHMRPDDPRLAMARQMSQETRR